MKTTERKPLEVHVEQYGEPEGIADQIRYALSLGLEEVQPGLVTHNGTFVIVGSSPSVVEQAFNINAQRNKGATICAVNGGHDFLMEHGITPNLALTIDPRAMTGQEPRPDTHNFKHKNPDTVYCLASRCHPTTFDYLKDCKRILWHCYSKEYEHEVIGERMLIGGGTTSGLRAISFGYVQGFRKFHLYGMDSCLGECNQKRYNTEGMPDEVKTVEVQVGERIFTCNMAMAQQANEFQDIYDMIPDVTIRAFGDGLLTAILRERHNMGLKT